MPEITYQREELPSSMETGPDWLLDECEDDILSEDLVSMFESDQLSLEPEFSGQAR